MRYLHRLLILGVVLGGPASLANAQPKDPPITPSRAESGSAADSIVARMMAFDKNKDGKLTRDEITDERLLRLFDRADTNKDGVVTREELTALAKQMSAEIGSSGSGPGGFGPPGGERGGPGGPGGRGGFGLPPRPGQVLPPFLRDALDLTSDQKKQLAELQKEVDSKLGKILTEEQKKQLQGMRGGPGRGGPGGPGGSDGPPPGPLPRP